ncbi:MAG: acyltransferase, partial [Acidobacteria bacterium]|nr:acyltransferase [Acidobacteriota bacterium]
EFLYRLTPFRVDTLAMGALLAVGVRDERWLKRLARWYRPVWVLALAGLCAVVWMAGTSRNNHPLVATWGFSLLSLIYACTVFHAHNGSAVLRFPPLRTLGKYSYGVYMMHFPLVGYFFIWMAPVGTALGPSLGAVVALALGTCASLGLALISWHLVEKRFLTLKDRFKAFNAG